MATATGTAMATADSSAALRNDNKRATATATTGSPPATRSDFEEDAFAPEEPVREETGRDYGDGEG